MTRSVRLLLPVGFALVLGLSGCGGGSSATADAAGATPAAASPSTEQSAPPVSEPAPVTAGNPLVAADFCAFLEKVAPKMADDGSPEGALATFSIALSGWISDHPEQQPRFAEDMDETSSASCAETRTAVLATLQEPSFDDAF